MDGAPGECAPAHAQVLHNGLRVARDPTRERCAHQTNPNASSQCRLAPWQAKRLAAYIESNIGTNLRVANLAAVVQLSIGHFSRAFKVSFGQPPITYVKERRVRHAQAIMLNTREPLSQVALECGLYDHSHLTRLFRKVVGISPSLWRQQFQSQPMNADDMLRRATHEVSEAETASQLVRRDTAATSSPVGGSSRRDIETSDIAE